MSNTYPKINRAEQLILTIFLKSEKLASSEVRAELEKSGSTVSLVTIKRKLAKLKDTGLLSVSGAGRSVAYSLSPFGRLFIDIDSTVYCSIEPDKRYGMKTFNFELFNSISDDLFSELEMQKLEEATAVYRKNIQSISATLEEKELERFIIELSWKSSKIEGNTYTLLDTEKLIVRGIEALGHDKDEARMILNHKQAFNLIYENVESFKELTQGKIDEIHKMLVKDLKVNYGVRKKPVGVTGSLYRPLENEYQIQDALTALCRAVNRLSSPYTKAILALLGVSYIQPFEDGNKRTSRLIANALLLSNRCAPLSYRSVDENTYREAMLVFYELNSVVAFKKIFIEQYVFAAHNYAVAKIIASTR
jgi:Fic family protein